MAPWIYLRRYSTDRGSIVMAWEPLVVMLRKLFITLAGACARARCVLPSARHVITAALLPHQR